MKSPPTQMKRKIMRDMVITMEIIVMATIATKTTVIIIPARGQQMRGFPLLCLIPFDSYA